MGLILGQSFFLLLFPVVIFRLCGRYSYLGKIGPIVLSYGIGLVAANIPGVPVDDTVSNLFVQLTVPLTIVLLLLPTDFMLWLRNAGSAIASFALCILSVVISSLAAGWLFESYTEESAKVAGMMIGLYTGGTPNMSAIGLALGIKDETFILLNSADLVLGGIYLIFLMSIAQRVLNLFLPRYKRIYSRKVDPQAPDKEASTKHAGHSISRYMPSLGLAAGILGVSVGLSYLFTHQVSEVSVILMVTTFGIGASFNRGLRNLPGSYRAGEYLLMIFCIAIGSLANIGELLDSSSTLLLFATVVMAGSISLHLLFAALFRIDTDTVLITSTAGLYGPAFVPVVAKSLKNNDIVVSGLTTGLVGYAVANYLGLAVAWLLQ